MPRLSVIIPTFREAENLPVLIPRIHEATGKAGLDAEIIIVDDNSEDGTREACDALAKRYPLRLMIRGEERGLSSAVVAGMEEAAGDLLLVMDADLSHPPEKIPELVRALDDPEVDFALGSRYVPGGSTAEDWGVFRWLNSRAATLLAKPLTAVKDPMAGFFALRREAFRSAASHLDPIGYKIGLELIVKCGCRKVAEIPIAFAKRLKGESKLNFREQINYLRHVHQLYEYRHRGWAYFTQVAADLVAFSLLRIWIPFSWARGIAVSLAMGWYWIARSRESLPRRPAGFFASRLLGAIVNWSASMALWGSIPFFTSHPVAAAAAGIVAGTLFNFILCRCCLSRLRQARACPSHPKPDGPEETESPAASGIANSRSSGKP